MNEWTNEPDVICISESRQGRNGPLYKTVMKALKKGWPIQCYSLTTFFSFNLTSFNHACVCGSVGMSSTEVGFTGL